MRETCRSILHHVTFDIANSLLLPPFIAHNCSITNFTSKLTRIFPFFRFIFTKNRHVSCRNSFVKDLLLYCPAKKQEENKKNAGGKQKKSRLPHKGNRRISSQLKIVCYRLSPPIALCLSPCHSLSYPPTLTV